MTMGAEMEQSLVGLAEFQRDHHFGKYRGLVSDIGDPDGMGRIRATVPAVYGEIDSPWALPALPFAGAGHGLVLLPEVGDGVWIEFEAGDIARPIWSGGWWQRDQRPDPKGDTVRLLSTSGGHQLVLDEAADEIRLKHPGGAEIVLAADGITLSFGSCTLQISRSEIDLNHGMVKVTTAGASLVNDAMKIGA